jgi:hypothetical protein
MKRATLFLIFVFLFTSEAKGFPLDMANSSWTAGTFPANHYVNIASISTPYGDGVSVNTFGYPGAYEYNYDFFAYYDEPLLVPPSGSIEVTGCFKYNDITPHLQRKYLAMYLLRPDLSGYVCNQTCILNYTTGDAPDVWYNRTVVVSGLKQGEEFRLAFGRSDLCDMDRRLEASWAAVDVVSCRTLKVPGDCSTVQEAVGEAAAGDVIQVASGVYRQRLVVDKDYLRIIGEDSGTTIIDANVEDNSTCAAVRITGKDVLLSGFTIRNCEDTYGIAVYGEDATITGNNIMNNTVGVGVFANDSKVVTNNICNNLQGIWLQNDAENCTFYHNNFMNNTKHAYHQPPCQGANKWDNGYEGNFWDGYTGTDTNGDGVGETPYPVSPNNIDEYPLMKPYMLGDVNHDGIVNMMDLYLIAEAYGSGPRDPNWNPHCDVNGDGLINMMDLYIAATHYGENCP